LELHEFLRICSAAACNMLVRKAAQGTTSSGWGGLVRTAALAAASPTFADLQMSFVMDHDLANTFYSFLSSSLREIILHYFFVSLLFLTMFRCCIQMPLDGFFWCDGIWEEDM